MDVLTPELRPSPERGRHALLDHDDDDELPPKHSHRHRHNHRNRGDAKEDETLPKNGGAKHSREGKSSSKHKHKRHKHRHRRKHTREHADDSSEEGRSRKDEKEMRDGKDASARCSEKDDASMDDAEVQDRNMNQKPDFAEDGIVEGEKQGVTEIPNEMEEERSMSHSEDAKKSVSRSMDSVSLVSLADDKEEGEILEEEENEADMHRRVESDAEPGEIQTHILLAQSHELLTEGRCREEQNYSGALGQAQRDGKGLHSGALSTQGIIHGGVPVLESIMDIAKAYDSDHSSEDHNMDEETVEDSLKRKLKKRPSKSPESHNHKRRNCRSISLEKETNIEETSLGNMSPESSKEQYPSQETENERHEKEGMLVQSNKSLPDQDQALDSDSKDRNHQIDDTSIVSIPINNQKDYDNKTKDEQMVPTCHHRQSGSKDNIGHSSKERVERSTSKERAHRHRYDIRAPSSDSRRRSKSRETDHDSRHGKDSPSRNGRYRRSRSRETGRDHREKYERSKESIYDSKSKDNYGKGERARRSRSRDSERQSKYIKDVNDHRRRSASRETDHDSRYAARDAREVTERSKRSRSRDVLHETRHSGRAKEAPYDSRDRDRHEQRHSRPREENQPRSSGRDYTERRRSTSRGRRDSMERSRRSRSRAGTRDRRDYLDRRRRSRSRENTRSGRTEDSYRHRNARGEEHDRLAEGLSGSGRERSDVKNIKDVGADFRMEEDEEENLDNGKILSEDEDVERIKEESRRRRQAILEKYKNQDELKNQLKEPEGNDLNLIQRTDTELVESDLVNDAKGVDDAVSDDSKKPLFDLGKGSVQANTSDRPSGARGLGEGTPKNDKSNDMFCDYIFGESPAGGRKLVKGDGIALETSGLTDNWDDPEGYYCYRIGEVLDGRYEVAASHGRGVFSSVVRARDMKASGKEHDEVAIKIIRNNDVMFKSGQQELVILKKLAGADPDNRRHCVLFLTSFEYRNHLCLVFESLHMNLREILKKFGRNIGINLTAVRAYAKQLFIALKHLRNCGVLHCDIKPDNMLVNEAKNALKLCDFGSAMFAGENEITPYLVSRFYRAPEIILGLPYDHPLDIWSVGCCLYEFFTGKVLFPGPTNNDMLKLHMELKGPFPKKMLKKASFASKHFDQDYNFCAVEEDPVTKTNIKRVLVNIKPRDIGSLLSGHGTADEDPKMLSNFKDLLEKIFMLDPEKRLTVSQALNHPFITGK